MVWLVGVRAVTIRMAEGGAADWLEGGRGNDILTGSAGMDVFVFANRFGKDKVTDFAARNGEVIDLTGVSGITGFNDLVNNHLQTANISGFAMIVVGTNSILLEGVTVGQIGAGLAYSGSDFLFG